MHRHLLVLGLVAGLGGPLPAHAENLGSDEDKAAWTKVKDRLIVLTDGKGHFLVTGALDPRTATYDQQDVVFYFGTTKVLYGGADQWSELDHDQDRAAMEVTDFRHRSRLELRSGVYTFQCDERTIKLSAASAKDTKRVLEQAAFKPRRFARSPLGLARDDAGVYYYVDGRWGDFDPAFGRRVQDYQLYVGKRGALKRVPIKEVADDEGDLLIMAHTGSLRVTWSRMESNWNAATWIRGARKTELKNLPLSTPTLQRIFRGDLGIYVTQRFDVPCDDL